MSVKEKVGRGFITQDPHPVGLPQWETYTVLTKEGEGSVQKGNTQKYEQILL